MRFPKNIMSTIVGEGCNDDDGCNKVGGCKKDDSCEEDKDEHCDKNECCAKSKGCAEVMVAQHLLKFRALDKGEGDMPKIIFMSQICCLIQFWEALVCISHMVSNV